MKTAAILTGVLATALTLSGCMGSSSSEPTRSKAAFCATFKKQAIALHDKYESADQAASDGTSLGMLSGFSSIVQAPGDMVVLFDSLDKAAPNDIEPSVAEVLNSLRKMQDAQKDALTNPLSALGSGLVSALTSGGAYQQVNDYITANCDLSFEW